jgi:hypothetical protein
MNKLEKLGVDIAIGRLSLEKEMSLVVEDTVAVIRTFFIGFE